MKSEKEERRREQNRMKKENRKGEVNHCEFLGPLAG
jgi:hypothetical protein